MTLFLFLSLIVSSTGGDLVPPFTLDSENKVGFWEFNGMTVVHENYILISPPIQFTRGSLWTNLEFPEVDWSVQFELGISQGTGGGGGFAIWFIDNYGADGKLFGGPSQFRGIAISGSVKTTSDQTQIDFKLMQDHGNLEFHKASDSDATIYLDEKNHNIALKISFRSGYMHLEHFNNETNEWKLLSKMLVKVDISKNYLGISAQSDQETSRFDLFSLNFSIIESSRKDTSLKQHSTGYYSPEYTLRFRNPKLKKILIEMGKMEEKPDAESTATDLLDIVHEINSAVFDVASYSDVNDFVTQTLLPYTQKWHKRTLKVVADIQNAMNVYGAVWNYTNILIGNFKTDLQNSARKITAKIENLEEILRSENFEPDVNPNLGKVIVISLNANDYDPFILVLYFLIAELTVSFSLLFLYQKRKLYD